MRRRYQTRPWRSARLRLRVHLRCEYCSRLWPSCDHHWRTFEQERSYWCSIGFLDPDRDRGADFLIRAARERLNGLVERWQRKGPAEV